MVVVSGSNITISSSIIRSPEGVLLNPTTSSTMDSGPSTIESLNTNKSIHDLERVEEKKNLASDIIKSPFCEVSPSVSDKCV